MEERLSVDYLRSENSIVSAVRANNYSLAELVPAVKQSLELIGGLNSLVRPGDKVFVKINHLSPPSPPERGIVTHPIFVEAVLTLLKEMKVEIVVGDDIEEGNVDGYTISRFREMCDRQGVKLVNLKEMGFVEKPCNGKLLKNVYISKIVDEADVLINLPKFKTHSLTIFTGGIKNLYGVVPDGLRRRFHRDYLKPEDFCQMLVDVYSITRPELTIIDGVMAMEGEGPGSGKMRNLGLILAGQDTTAVDAVASRIIGVKPEDVLTTRYAGERGLGISDLKKIKIAGEKLDSFAVPDFKLPVNAYRLAVKSIPYALIKQILKQVAPRPRIKKKNCTACNKCVKACPTGAAAMVGKTAAINDKLCIRCMCCHEVCRFNAVYPGRSFFGNILYGMFRAARRTVRA
jgi:uncharacterized protein (DUF362 family)/Pyruvate/2-oxoacid:ferredoxin oxidoreductase delta subunit